MMKRLINLLLSLLLLTVLAGFTTGSNPDRYSARQKQDTGIPKAASQTLTISYAEATSWLDNLAPEDHTDQILDWTVWSLAGLLELDAETVRDGLYDKIPLRDPLFNDLSMNPVGPGRGLLDESNTLHLLAPANNPHAARAIGLVLDDHRKDAGVDPQSVLIYWYEIDSQAQQVTLEPDQPQPTRAVRKAYGYQEMAVGSLDALDRFLTGTHHLSRLELRGTQLWAAGWNWPNTPTGQVTAQDLTVLQQGYLEAAQAPAAAEQTTALLEQNELIDFSVRWYGAESGIELFLLLYDEYVYTELLTETEYADMMAKIEEAETDKQVEESLVNAVEVITAKLEERLKDDETLQELAESDTLGPVASEPGFSLDPGQPMTVSELLDILDPAQYPALTEQPEAIEFALAYSQAQTPEEQVELLVSDYVVEEILTEEDALVVGTLYELAETDEAMEAVNSVYIELVFERLGEKLGDPHLFGLIEDTVQGRPPYQMARYDGGLQGTEAGMTYFYTDLVAKAWRMERGTGAPMGKVPGFISDIQAQTPWGHCKSESETGRLWFGLREEAISIDDSAINLGGVTTRVFTLIEDPQFGDREIEPSYSFGRIIWWWDRHYQAMADYEPEYHRLDQLMRWGAAIGWLLDQESALLPELPERQIKRDWRFDDWLATHPDLKWQFDVPFVEPPGVTTEALLTIYSQPVADCGQTWNFSGGISNPALKRLREIFELRPQLKPAVARGGLSQVGTDFSATTRSGTISNLDGTLTRTLHPIQGSVAKVDTVADGRKVWSLGKTKAWVDETSPRQMSVESTVRPGKISQKFNINELEIGQLSVTTEGTVATVQFEPGLLQRAQRLVDSIQEFLAQPGQTMRQAVTAAKKESQIAIQEVDTGRVLVQLDESANSRWVAIEQSAVSSGDGLSFRLGQPGEAAGDIVWHQAQVTRPPTNLPARLKAAAQSGLDTDVPLVKYQNGEALIVGRPQVERLDTSLGTVEYAKLVADSQELARPTARGPPRFYAKGLIEEGQLLAATYDPGQKIQLVKVKVARSDVTMLEPDLADLFGTEFRQPGGTPKVRPIGPEIVIAFPVGSCQVEEDVLICEDDQ